MTPKADMTTDSTTPCKIKCIYNSDGVCVNCGKRRDETTPVPPKSFELTFDGFRQAQLERQKEWDPSDVITLEFRGNELAGEVGEACNVVKKIARSRLGLRGGKTLEELREHLAQELADVVICADLIAMQAGIDLGNAVADKFNATSEKYGLSKRILREEREREIPLGAEGINTLIVMALKLTNEDRSILIKNLQARTHLTHGSTV